MICLNYSSCFRVKKSDTKVNQVFMKCINNKYFIQGS
jgi:hypothetical protein